MIKGQKVIFDSYAGPVDGVIKEVTPSGKFIKVGFPDSMVPDTGWIASDTPKILEIIDLLPGQAQ